MKASAVLKNEGHKDFQGNNLAVKMMQLDIESEF